MNGFDMHIHSNSSDGQLDVCKIIDIARNVPGLTGISITDHDTVAALPRAISYAKKYNYPLIPGIELSAAYEEYDVHILGFWIDISTIMANGCLQQLCAARQERFYNMAYRLGLLGMPIDAEAVVAGTAGTGNALGRLHIAQAMVAAGYVEHIEEAFTNWLGRGMPAYAPRLKFNPEEAIELIAEARGIAVLAHPGMGVPDHVVGRLVGLGLGGLEVYHSAHDDKAVNKYLQMAGQYHIAALGGSDFHRPGQRYIGSHITSPEQLQFLNKRRKW
ncbi:MAG: PHP domain-containing protein [Clostridiales bacterium]|nr:PHP domain-containing protein [Clostridiales bacterium]